MQLLDLPDEVLVNIATQLPLTDFVHLQRTNKKLWEHLSQLAVFQRLLKVRSIASPYSEMLPSLEHLHLFEQIQLAGLLDDNRIGFELGSTDIFTDDFDGDRSATDIKGSEARIDATKRLLRTNPKLLLMIDAHSGTAAPTHDVAGEFSVFRGGIVIEEFSEFISDTAESTRVAMRAWGKRAAEAAANSDHKYAATAKEGKGWVELKIGLHNDPNFQVPVHPDYYDGLEPEEFEWAEDEDEHDEADGEDEDEDAIEVHYEIDEDDDDGDDDDNQPPRRRQRLR